MDLGEHGTFAMSKECIFCEWVFECMGAGGLGLEHITDGSGWWAEEHGLFPTGEWKDSRMAGLGCHWYTHVLTWKPSPFHGGKIQPKTSRFQIRVTFWNQRSLCLYSLFIWDSYSHPKPDWRPRGLCFFVFFLFSRVSLKGPERKGVPTMFVYEITTYFKQCQLGFETTTIIRRLGEGAAKENFSLMYKNDKTNVITSEQKRCVFFQSQHQASGMKWNRASLSPVPLRRESSIE